MAGPPSAEAAIAENLGVPPGCLPQEDREDRQKRIEWWDQGKLAGARVLIAGTGALGNEVVKNLALLGVGHLYLADFDTIELTNLSRTVLFREGDLGQSKALIAATRAAELNPHIHIVPMHVDVNYDIGLGLFRRADVVIGCLDNLLARIAVNKACMRVKRPLIEGGMLELHGQVRMYLPPEGPCLECRLTEEDYKDLRRRFSCPGLAEAESAGAAPTTQTISAIIAGFQSQEAVKIIHGHIPPPGQAIYVNGLHNTVEVVVLSRREDCLGHWSFEDDAIIRIPDARAETTTVRQVLEWGRQRTGQGTVVELDRDIITHFTCERCEAFEEVMTPRGKVPQDRQRCPKCGAERIFEILSGAVDENSPYLDRTLGSIGIPPFHIVSVRRGTEYLHFELSGDEAKVLGGEATAPMARPPGP